MRPGMRKLDRYVLSEIVGPLGLGFVVYTFILLMQFLFRSADLIIRRGLPVGVVLRLLLDTLPSILVLTVPMSLLFGILVAVGRLASDSELVAIRAGGVSLYALYRPILVISGLLFALNLGMMLWALPAGNHALQSLRIEIATRAAAQEVEARVFNEDWEGKVLYVFETPPRAGWRGVFLAPALPEAENEVTVADRGTVRADPSGERATIHLENAYTHKVDLDNPQKYEVSHSLVLDQALQIRSPGVRGGTVSKGVRERTIGELVEMMNEPDTSPELRRLAKVEIHKKIAIPAACLVFGLFALPLGFNNRRGGKSSGFTISLGVILVYYVLLNNGEEAARLGRVSPWLAMWAPNLLLTVAGSFFAIRRNRDKSLLIWRIDHWIEVGWDRLTRRLRARQAKRRAARAEARALELSGAIAIPGRGRQIVLRLPRLRLAFPNLLDRYVLRTFGWSFVLVTLSVMVIYVIADFTQIVDDVLKNRIATTVVVDYYKYLSLQIFYEMAPMLVLISTLVTLSMMSRSNEVTACKALGISLYRLCVPVLAAALSVSMACVFLESEVLPASNQEAAVLKDRINGKEPTTRTRRRADQQWLFGQGRYVYNYMHFDAKRALLQRLQVFEFDKSYHLVRRIYAASARFDHARSRWVFTDSWARTFDGAAVTSFQRYPQPILVDYPETPEYFQSDEKRPEEMTFGELRSYVRTLRDSGQAVPELEVELHSKVAFPVISLIMAVVGLPFAFRIGRRGTLYGVGISVVLGILFVGVFAFFRTMGQISALPPIVAVWSPSLIFALYAVYLFLGVET